MPPPKPTPTQKLRIASALYATARKIKAAALRSKHPDWPESKINYHINRRLSLVHD